MSYGWKFGLTITLIVCVGFVDAFFQAISAYLKDKGSSK